MRLHSFFLLCRRLCSARLAAFVCAWLPAALLAADWQIEQRMQSEHGEIQLARRIDEDGDRGPPAVILLNGRPVHDATDEEPYLNLLGLYRLADRRQALLFSRNCGGSGCRVTELSFLIIGGKSGPALVTRDDFTSETLSDTEIRVHAQGGRIVVDLGHERRLKKTAVLDAGGLSMHLAPSSIRELPQAWCQSLHVAMQDCIHEKELGRCSDYEKVDLWKGGFVGGNAMSWGVRMAAHQPGFNQPGFAARCRQACLSGHAGSYAAFQQQACRLPPG